MELSKIFIGQLDRQVVISRKTETTSSTGAVTIGYEPLTTTFAKMEEVSGKEDDEGKVIHLIDRKYFTRYRPDLIANATNLVLEDKGQKFEVIHVMEIGRKDRLEFRVKRYE